MPYYLVHKKSCLAAMKASRCERGLGSWWRSEKESIAWFCRAASLTMKETVTEKNNVLMNGDISESATLTISVRILFPICWSRVGRTGRLTKPSCIEFKKPFLRSHVLRSADYRVEIRGQILPSKLLEAAMSQDAKSKTYRHTWVHEWMTFLISNVRSDSDLSHEAMSAFDSPRGLPTLFRLDTSRKVK